MKLIVGLGNPGKPYEHTRHNVGFDALDLIADRLNIHQARSRCHALIAEGTAFGERVALMKPQTYMNESGRAVQEALHWYKIEPEDVLIISDDIDLAAGDVRVRMKGGAGTHNGWRSILRETGSEGFPRVRIGIGTPPPYMDLADFVLSRYTQGEGADAIGAALDRAADAVVCFLQQGMDRAMNQFNTRKHAD